MEKQERIAQVREAIGQLTARLPKHSVPPAMIIELEELEEELAELTGQAERGHDRRFAV